MFEAMRSVPRSPTSERRLPRRVLHVLNSTAGGSALSTLALVNGLRERGIESAVYSIPSGAPAERARFERATEGRFAVGPLYLWHRKMSAKRWKRPFLEVRQLARTGALVRSTRALAQFADRYACDLVHSNTFLTVEGGLVARRLGIPHVWHVRELVGPGSPFRFPLEGRVLHPLLRASASIVVANSSVTAERLSKWVPEDLLATVWNGIELDSFLSLPVDTRDVPVVAMVANTSSHWKKHSVFIEAAAKVTPNAEFRIYGHHDPKRDDYAAGLERLALSAPANRRVRFMGFRAEPSEIMREIDVLVHPASDESFGRIIVEAMAANRAVIGVREGAVASLVDHGTDGLLAAPDAPDAIAEQISRVLADPNLRASLGAGGRRTAKARFSIRAHVDGMLEVYEAARARPLGSGR